MRNEAPESVAVVGLGYVGCVTAACLAHLGHRVVGVDRDQHKVDAVLSGRAPFYEPGLEALVCSGMSAGRLSATTSLEEALRASDIALICVGTPSERNGNLNLEQLRRVCSEIGAHTEVRGRPLIAAVRSTVFPGVCEEVVMPRVGAAAVVANPEFLREGAAVRDFMEPSLVVVGGAEAPAVDRVARLYQPLGVAPCCVSLRTAEMIKYACNAFHAVKIAFANEVGSLAAAAGIDANEVLATLCNDTRLNISSAYLKPGFAFGGSCLPKDLRALAYRAARLDLRLPLLENVLASNEQHLRRAIDSVMDLPARRVGIFGLAFKEDTDDLRESPVVALIEFLIGKGRDLRIFDPQIRLENIYGSNRGFLFSAVPHIERLMVASFDELSASSDHLVIAQRPSAAFAERIAASGLPVLDLTVVRRR
ncbi:MAG: nucleotide sugar dehydrogenase [Bryobacteraceae bacterium]|nr:nucleotide sugar dehydrogenase [Bryobacteraceae bacterium]